MLQGLGVVLAIFFITLIVSIPLGILVMFLRLSKNQLVSGITQCYILIMRGTPLLLQMIVIFYGLPIIGITFDRFTAGIIAFIFNYAAYFAEIFRGGIQSIDRGQYEASKVLGFDKVTMYKRIIFPQVFKKILPPVSNEVITLVKDTSLVYILGLNDILRIAQIAMNRDVSLIPLFQAGAIYLLFVAILTKGFELLEKKFSYYK